MTVAQTKDPIKTLTQEVGALRTRVATLESERPGRKPKPLLAIKQRDVCAIDPDSDSTKCPFASIYRYQSGCHGAKCRLKQHESYERRKAARSNGTAVKVKPPAKKTVASRSQTAKKILKAAETAPPKRRVVKQTTKATTKAPAKRTKRVSPAKRTVKRMAS